MNILVPRINPNDDSVLVARWHFADGDNVSKDAPLVDLETSKTVVTIDAPATGLISIRVKAGEYAEVDSPIGEIATINQHPSRKSSDSGDSIRHQDKPSEDHLMATGGPIFSNAAKEYIRERKISLNDIPMKGLVTVHDLKCDSTKGVKREVFVERAPKKNTLSPLSSREINQKPAKREEIRQLQIGQNGLINSTLTVTINLSSEYNIDVNDGMSFVRVKFKLIEIICRQLTSAPYFTAYHHDDRIHFYDRVDLGYALDLENGLKVVRIKDANELSAAEIHNAISELALCDIRNELIHEQLTGSTFTITDLTEQNILNFVPLINGHQSIIIGLGADRFQRDFPLSIIITFDHRVLSGKQVAIYLNSLRDLLRREL